MKIKQTLKNLWEKFVIHKYASVGLHWGDLESYCFMGEPYGYNSVCKSLDYWESKYEKLGYVPVDRDIWVSAGGYGGEYQSHLKLRK